MYRLSELKRLIPKNQKAITARKRKAPVCAYTPTVVLNKEIIKNETDLLLYNRL